MILNHGVNGVLDSLLELGPQHQERNKRSQMNKKDDPQDVVVDDEEASAVAAGANYARQADHKDDGAEHQEENGQVLDVVCAASERTFYFFGDFIKQSGPFYNCADGKEARTDDEKNDVYDDQYDLE